jgi:hypothetical protein
VLLVLGAGVRCRAHGKSGGLTQKDRSFPDVVPLAHDVVAYFDELRSVPSLDAVPETFTRLADRPPGELRILSPASLTDMGYEQLDVMLTLG